MKRKLEAELISIAHRILKLRNKSELAQLQQETLKLYEKISVLRFVEENFSEVKPTIGYASAEKEVEAVYEAQENIEVEEKEVKAEIHAATEPWTQIVSEEDKADAEVEDEEEDTEILEEETEVEQEEVDDFPAEDNVEEVNSDQKEEPQVETEVEEEESFVAEEEFSDEEQPELIEDVQEEVEVEEAEVIEEEEAEFKPLFDIPVEEVPELVLPKQITLEDFLSDGHVEPIFVRAEQSYTNETTTTQKNPEDEKETVTKVEVIETKKTQFVIDHQEPKSRSLNDSLSKTINIGLNDRFGFERNLFGGSSEDMNRVLSQLSTFSNFSEAQEFIDDMVKPDYNNWAGKDEYAARFMEIVEKKFS